MHGFTDTTTEKSNDNLPNLTSIVQMDEAEVNKIVCGYRREQLADVWGNPDESSSMEDIWVIESDITLTVNYHNNNDKAVMCDGTVKSYAQIRLQTLAENEVSRQ